MFGFIGYCYHSHDKRPLKNVLGTVMNQSESEDDSSWPRLRRLSREAGPSSGSWFSWSSSLRLFWFRRFRYIRASSVHLFVITALGNAKKDLATIKTKKKYLKEDIYKKNKFLMIPCEPMLYGGRIRNTNKLLLFIVYITLLWNILFNEKITNLQTRNRQVSIQTWSSISLQLLV